MLLKLLKIRKEMIITMSKTITKDPRFSFAKQIVAIALTALLLTNFAFSLVLEPFNQLAARSLSSSESGEEIKHLKKTSRYDFLSATLAPDEFTFQTKLVASNGTAEANLGLGVGVSGNTAIAFAFAPNPGLYVFVREGTTWTEQAFLVPSDGIPAGTRLVAAISGDTIVMGGSRATVNSNTGQGAAYVFVRNGSVWTEQQRLTASDGAADDEFGYDVSISNNTIIVGAPFDDVAVTNQGSAYIFARQAATWTEQAKLLADDPTVTRRLFGTKVAIDGNTAAVSSALNNASDIPFVYIFVRSGAAWTQQDKFSVCEPSDANVCDFGWRSLAVSGDTVVTSNRRVNIGSNIRQGAAYVFVRSGTTWSQQQRLIASDGQTDDWFGISVAIEADTIVVGAAALFIRRGSAYVFTRSQGVWTQQQKLHSSTTPPNISDRFGTSVSINGNTIIVGASRETVNGNANQGAAYVYTSSNTSRRTLFDFDGDGKTDLSIFRPSAGEWWYLRSSDGGNRAFQFGNSSD